MAERIRLKNIQTQKEEKEAREKLKWKCTHCGQQMKNKHSLKQHKKIHQKPVNCLYPDCEKHFARENQMRLHLRNKHRKKV